MTITRLHIFAAEQASYRDDIAQFTDDGTLPVLSSTQLKTGDFSYRLDTNTTAFGRGFSSYYAGFRVGAWLRHIGINDLNGQVYLYVAAHDSNRVGMNIRAIINAESGTFQVVRQLNDDDTEILLEEDIHPLLMRENVWMHIGVVHVIHATTGVLNFYCDGTLVHEVEDGDTRLATYNELGQTIIYSAQASHIFMLGSVAGGSVAGWNDYAYVDDYYIDAYVDEDPIVVPPAYRFLYSTPTAAGTHDDWTPQGDATNEACIDEMPPDGETTYNWTDTVDQRDSFQVEDISRPIDHIISAVIPIAHARRVHVSDAPRLILHAFDGLNFGESGEMALPMDWTHPLLYRMEDAPDGSAWSEADVNGCEFGYTSETA